MPPFGAGAGVQVNAAIPRRSTQVVQACGIAPGNGSLRADALPQAGRGSNMRTHAAECAVDSPGMAMQELVDRYGALLVFANVLALSLGLPVPATTTLVLVAAGLGYDAAIMADTKSA